MTNINIDNATTGNLTSYDTSAGFTLGSSVNDPPTHADVQAISDKLDELINALRR